MYAAAGAAADDLIRSQYRLQRACGGIFAFVIGRRPAISGSWFRDVDDEDTDDDDQSTPLCDDSDHSDEDLASDRAITIKQQRRQPLEEAHLQQMVDVVDEQLQPPQCHNESSRRMRLAEGPEGVDGSCGTKRKHAY